jgi:hypothetical protein
MRGSNTHHAPYDVGNHRSRRATHAPFRAAGAVDRHPLLRRPAEVTTMLFAGGTCTAARHFSNEALMKRNRMLAVAAILMTALPSAIHASGPGTPAEPPAQAVAPTTSPANTTSSATRCVAFPQPQCPPGAASLGSGTWYGQGA